MDQKKLLSDLKAGDIKQAYLLHGAERYLVLHYAKAIEKAVLTEGASAFAKDVFEGATPAHEMIMAAETLPFLAEHRLIIVKDSKLFATGRKEDSEKMANYLPNIPPSTVMVFAETEIDRRSKLFKEMSKVGCVLDCEPQSPGTLSTWAVRLAKEKGKTLSLGVANHFVRVVGADMAHIANEMGKLTAYCGQQQDIGIEDVNNICTPTLESRVFDLIKAMVSGRTPQALALYRDMLLLKESPIMILTMIVRQFRIILLCKCAKGKGMTIYEIAKELGLRDFMVQEALGQGGRYTERELLDALTHCQDVDIQIKTGLITPEFGVEMLLIKQAKGVAKTG